MEITNDFFNKYPITKLECTIDESNNTISLYNNSNIIFIGTFLMIGSYNIVNKIWVWSYAMEYIDKNICIKKKYVNSLYNYIKNNENMFKRNIYEDHIFKSTNDIFYMDNINNILNLLQVLTRMKQYVGILKVYYDNNIMKIYNKNNTDIKNVYFILIKNIIQKY